MTIINSYPNSSKDKKCYQKIKMIVACDKEDTVLLLQNALKQKKNLKIVGIVKSYQELLKQAIVLQPDIVIADLKINKIYRAINTIVNFKSFECKIIIVSDRYNKFLKRVLKNKPYSYILTNNSIQEIKSVVDSVVENIIKKPSELSIEAIIPELEILEATRETVESNSQNKKNILKSLLSSNWKKISHNKLI